MDRLERLREIQQEVKALPPTEANLEKALSLMAEATGLMADEVQDGRGKFDALLKGGTLPSNPAPTPTPGSAVPVEMPKVSDEAVEAAKQNADAAHEAAQ